jgi:Cdc6-like AAA superfamily ATPase
MDQFKLVLGVNPYSQASIAQIINQRLKPLGWNITEKAMEHVVHSSAGYPGWALRTLEVAHLLSRAEGKGEITTVHVKKAVEHVLHNRGYRVIKSLMGHASITTTEKHYLQKSDDNTRAAVRRYEALLGNQIDVQLTYGAKNDPKDEKSSEAKTAVSPPKTES